MAQVLKESLRQAILDAARNEFLEKGFKNASMRSIAAKAGMTVGNLYRYFKNKEELSKCVTEDAIGDFEAVLKDLRFENISMEPRVYNAKVNTAELIGYIDKMVDRLIAIAERSEDELNIIMMNQKCGKELTIWFRSIISSLIDQHYYIEDNRYERTMLSRTYAVAMHTGVRELIRNHDQSNETLKSLLKTYLHSYVHMLEDGFRTVKD